jgi:hypothetical protein
MTDKNGNGKTHISLYKESCIRKFQNLNIFKAKYCSRFAENLSKNALDICILKFSKGDQFAVIVNWT